VTMATCCQRTVAAVATTHSLEEDDMRAWTRISLSVVWMLLVLPPRATAQTADELAKQTQNPVASLISVPLQGNWDFGLGNRDATGTTLNIQPVMPFGISSGSAHRSSH